jgi:peroxiredoxin
MFLKKHMRFWIITVTLAIAATAANATPDIALIDMDGKPRNVNEFIGKGKWVTVMIWAHNCPICNAEAHQMAFFHDEHHKKDAIVLGISIDGNQNSSKAREFVERHRLDFTNLIAEPEVHVLGKFGGGPFYGTPTFYLYAPDGQLVARRVGATSQEDIEALIDKHSRLASQ